METNNVPDKKNENEEFSLFFNKIYEIRGQIVMLDFDIAEKYEVETAQLKRQVRRNIERFEGDDCMFVLTKKEFETLRCQIGTSKRGGTRYLPFAFTEVGIAMLSSVLNSEKAINVNKKIMRTFVAFRNFVLNYASIKQDLEEFKSETKEQISDIYGVLDELTEYKQEQQKPRTPIGFKQGK